MEPTWILVADAARARLFTVERPRGPLQEIADFVNPAERLRERDIDTDDRGRVAAPGGGRHAVGDDKSPKAEYARRFADELAQYLKHGRLRDEYRRLYLVADPRFLGELRAALDAPTGRLVVAALDKDISRREPADIRRHLPERL